MCVGQGGKVFNMFPLTQQTVEGSITSIEYLHQPLAGMSVFVEVGMEQATNERGGGASAAVLMKLPSSYRLAYRLRKLSVICLKLLSSNRRVQMGCKGCKGWTDVEVNENWCGRGFWTKGAR